MKKIQKEAAVLVLVIAVLGAYLFLRNGDRTHYSLPELQPVSAGDLTRIEIRRPGDSVVLEKDKEGRWRIQPGGKPADAGKADDIVKKTADLELTAMVSESAAYRRYDLGEDRRVSVEAWAGDERARAFSVGKTASSYKHTFVRLADDPEVYHAAGSLRFSFDQSAEELRDKQVLSFEPRDIRTITVRLEDRLTVLAREEAAGEGSEAAAEGEMQPVWKSREGDPLDAAAVNRLLTTLSDLDCSRFLADRSRSDLGEPLLSIRLEGSRVHELQVYPREDAEEGPYPAASSMVEEPFQLSAFSAENLMEIFQPPPEAEPEKASS